MLQLQSELMFCPAPPPTFRSSGLTSKANDLAKQMSGGQRRRLSLASALIGRPSVIFMDEPTTGMDPHNRQRCWQLLQQAKARPAPSEAFS